MPSKIYWVSYEGVKDQHQLLQKVREILDCYIKIFGNNNTAIINNQFCILVDLREEQKNILAASGFFILEAESPS